MIIVTVAQGQGEKVNKESRHEPGGFEAGPPCDGVFTLIQAWCWLWA